MSDTPQEETRRVPSVASVGSNAQTTKRQRVDLLLAGRPELVRKFAQIIGIDDPMLLADPEALLVCDQIQELAQAIASGTVAKQYVSAMLDASSLEATLLDGERFKATSNGPEISRFQLALHTTIGLLGASERSSKHLVHPNYAARAFDRLRGSTQSSNARDPLGW